MKYYVNEKVPGVSDRWPAKSGHRRTVYVKLGISIATREKIDTVNDGLIETDDEKELSDRELKRECFMYARKNFQGKFFTNIDTGRDILVSRDGLDEWYNKTKSREQSLSIKKLDSILKESKKVNSATDRKNRHTVDGFTYFETEMIINRTLNKVILFTRETHGKDSKYYYHFLEDIKIEPNSGLA